MSKIIVIKYIYDGHIYVYNKILQNNLTLQ